ncbi:MAG TPA: polysaccharide pyruvyl transferase family protein, partial [Chitinophagaceae bacterium]|nr:polysaccharide pyruvyl transferase family protein [Chitinophagaceae bacterium]
MNRKIFLQHAGMATAGILLSSAVNDLFAAKKQPTILLVSGWQDVNIGDIGHTPGLLQVFETFLPKSKVILWKRSNGEEVKKLLNKNFPEVKIIYGGVNAEKDVDSPEVLEAFKEADIMIHGSGPLLVGADNLASWLKHTGKPIGVFGATLENPSPYHQSILKKAAFIYTRETFSIQHLKKAGIEGRHVQFAPDATFYMHIQNKEKATQFLKANKLEDKKFICAIPRLRYTPYHKFNVNNNGWGPEKIKQVEDTNEKYKEVDHAKLREAIIAWVRETRNKVLVCPEMSYQVDIMDELLIDPLPADVKPFIVKRGYWLPDEAASVYARAHTVLSFECHSPIIAAANGTPFFYLRQPEDTIKGQMYYDLGLNDSIFEVDKTEGKQIADSLRTIWKDYKKAKAKLKTS